MKRKIALFVLVGLTIAGTSLLHARFKTVQEIYKEALTVTVFIREANKLPDIDSISPVGYLEGFWQKFWGTRAGSRATGMVLKINDKYYIATKSHVIENGPKGTPYYVWFNDRENSVKVLKHGWDDKDWYDWGILTFEDEKFVPPGYATLGDSASLTAAANETFYMLGNPFSAKRYWATGKIRNERGYVSGNKSVDIAFDIPCNPGESGGPVFNGYGEVIASVAYLRMGPNPICFASPINTFKALFPKLLQGGEIKHGKLDLAVLDTADFIPEELEKLGLKNIGENGVTVVSVGHDSPAEKAGVKFGDKILRAEKTDGSLQIKAKSSSEFIDALNLYFFAGDNVVLILKRGGGVERAQFIMGEASENKPSIVIVPKKPEEEKE